MHASFNWNSLVTPSVGWASGKFHNRDTFIRTYPRGRSLENGRLRSSPLDHQRRTSPTGYATAKVDGGYKKWIWISVPLSSHSILFMFSLSLKTNTLGIFFQAKLEKYRLNRD